MATGTQIINRATRQLLSGTTEQRNKLSSGIDASITTVICTYELGGLREGQTFEIDSELFYIWAADSGGKSLTVERGFNGTTAASHSAGALITVNPRFPRNQMLEAINDELADLSSPINGLFQVKTVNIDYNGSDPMIDLTGTSNIQEIMALSVRYLTDDYIPIRRFRVVRHMPTDDFPTGIALRIDQPVLAGRLRIVYKAPFSSLSSESDNLQTVAGLPAEAEDIIALGIQIRLMSPREIKRNFTESQGDTRRADEVPGGAIGNSITNLLRLRRDRITAEAQRLARQYPTLMTKV